MTDTTDLHRYSVQSGIPVAPRKYRHAVYPFGTMNVGDSFPLASIDYREVDRVRAAVQNWQVKHPPMKFAVRPDRKANGLRCWRIA